MTTGGQGPDTRRAVAVWGRGGEAAGLRAHGSVTCVRLGALSPCRLCSGRGVRPGSSEPHGWAGPADSCLLGASPGGIPESGGSARSGGGGQGPPGPPPGGRPAVPVPRRRWGGPGRRRDPPLPVSRVVLWTGRGRAQCVPRRSLSPTQRRGPRVAPGCRTSALVDDPALGPGGSQDVPSLDRSRSHRTSPWSV